MKDNQPLQLGPGLYYQGPGVLERLGGVCAAQGDRALVVAEDAIYDKVGDRIERSLAAAGVAAVRFPFAGHCSPANYGGAAALGREFGAACVVGAGGGRALDAAKIAAHKLGVRAVTVPTSAATCACTALLAVHYSDKGEFWGNYWPELAPAAALADLEVIAGDCPVRYNRAGMVDAMAKYPEITYNLRFDHRWEKSAMTAFSATAAEVLYRRLLELGGEGAERMAAGRWDGPVEDCVFLALSVTGLTSCMAFGGKQAAVSHGLYAHFCNQYPALAERFLHGELVGASLPYQTCLSVGREEAGRLSRFLRDLGMPACLEDLGFPTGDQGAVDGLFAALAGSLPVNGPEELARLRRHEAVLFAGL